MTITSDSGRQAEHPMRHVLTSADRNIRVDRWEITDRDAGIRSFAPWSIRKRTLHGGKQEGVDVIDLDNGRLRLTVVPTRGMGIARVDLDDTRLGWDSPVRELVHPRFVNLESRGGLGWLEGFSEWLARCGLEFAGHPGTDVFVNNVGERAEMQLTLHGKIANIPASEVEVVVDREPPHRLRIRGRVDERMFYGPKLELWTEISTEPGSPAFRIEDRLTNHGGFDQEFQIIYHANYGPPLLDEGARFAGAIRQATPFNAHAAAGLDGYERYLGPTPGFVEQVYCLRPYAGEDGRTTILLRNAAGDRGASMTFSLDELPYLTVWKNTAALEEGYVTGLEPGTGFPYNRRIERQFGRVPVLAPGASRTFVIDVGIHQGRDAVAEVDARIRTIQAGRPTQRDREPEWRPDR